MGIVYSDNEIAGSWMHKRPFKIDDFDATKLYLQHFANSLLLRFIAEHPDTNYNEKSQARKELAIAERKMAFWRRAPKFDQSAASNGADELKRTWRR